MRRHMITHACICIACACITPSRAFAQGQAPGTVTLSANATSLHQFESSLDPSGRLQWSNVAFSGSATRQMVPAFAAGVSVRCATEDWSMDAPGAFGGQAPWRTLERAGVGASLSLALSHAFLVGVSPALEWALESGARTRDALTYGAVASAVKVFGPRLTLGGGASVNRQFYSVKVSPFAIVNWKLNDRLRIANALPAGPEGGAGIEARGTLTPGLELAVGGVLRSDRYRLADEAPYAGFIGETSSTPIFARLSRKVGTTFRADFYAGTFTSARLRIKDPDGHEVATTSYAAAPAIAMTLSFKR